MNAAQKGERGRRPRNDILNVYEVAELVKRCRLYRQELLLVCDLVRGAIAPMTNRSQAIRVETKVATTLRCLAAGKMQLWLIPASHEKGARADFERCSDTYFHKEVCKVSPHLV